MVAWVSQAMRRLAPASSVRERSRRERESGSRARGTGRDRPARDAAAAHPVAPRDQPRPGSRGRRSPRIAGCRAGTGDRPEQSTRAVVARAVGIRKRVTRAFSWAAALETACGALAFTLPLALHRAHEVVGRVGLGWLAWLVFAVGSGALVGMVFLSLTRLQPERADVGFVLLATLLFGAGVGYAAELSPFLVCALATALIANASPRRHAVRRVLADWEPPIYAIFLVIAGALLTLPTLWILVAVPLLAAARAAAKWAAVRYGSVALHLGGFPPYVGLGTIAQGGAAIALGLNFFITYGTAGTGASGTLLTTVVLGVAAAQLAAPPLMVLALRTTAASPAAPAPLTPAAAPAELSANAPAEWPR